MIGVEGFVADVSDPEGMHRIRVIIPSIDEEAIHDEWIPALAPWVGAPGYGPVNLPEMGTEVLLFGRLGEKHSLFYLSRYNEDSPHPRRVRRRRGARAEDGRQIQAPRGFTD